MFSYALTDMKKLFTEFFSVSLFIIIFCQNIYQVSTLRCAHACSVGPIALGSPDPITTPCNTNDNDTATTMCTVSLSINFETSYIRGSLIEKPREVDKSSSLHLNHRFVPHKTITFIDYQCATADDCDQDFVRETISSSKWAQLDETKVQADIISLLFKTTSTNDTLTCANNRICSSNEHCSAQFTHNSSASQINFNDNFPCNNTSASTVIFNQYFSAPGDNQGWTMDVFCNKDGCNQRNTVEQVHNILRDNFTLPLNYSAFTPDPKPNGVHRINDGISISIFLFFCLYLYEKLFLNET